MSQENKPEQSEGVTPSSLVVPEETVTKPAFKLGAAAEEAAQRHRDHIARLLGLRVAEDEVVSPPTE